MGTDASRGDTGVGSAGGEPDLWEIHAGWWQEGFTEGADPEYSEQIVPLVADLLGGQRRVLDVGTGEGQLARVLARREVEVIGVDPTAAQIRRAIRRGGDPVYVRSGASELPFPAGSFDGALACLVFEHIEAMDAAMAEVARVLRPGGRFVLMLNHPLLQTPDAGWIDDHMVDPPEQYWRIGPYLVETETIEEVQLGVHIPFIHRPLSRYLNSMVDSGLALQRMIEPAPPPGFLARAPGYAAAATIPRLLVLVGTRM